VFGLACVATLVISPIARGHYFMLLLPALPLLPLWFRREGMPRWAVASALAPPLLVTLHYVALDPFGRMGLLGLGTAAWYLLSGLAVLLVSRTARASTEAEPAGTLPLPAGVSAARRAA
jgi:hypothetical protein